MINPGLFPIGVTPANVLHKNVRRNPYLAQVCYDLHLMDKEGSGIDKMYRVLLSNAKHIPVPYQGDDFVRFTILRRISNPEIIALINRANAEFQLTQREAISLGLVAQYTSMSAIDLSKELSLPEESVSTVNSWLGRLIDLGLVITKGKTKGMQYLINSDFLKKANFKGKTNLKGIESHRLEELIYQDVRKYQPTSLGEIHERIGKELSYNLVRRTIYKMVSDLKLFSEGFKASTRYSLDKKN